MTGEYGIYDAGPYRVVALKGKVHLTPRDVSPEEVYEAAREWADADSNYQGNYDNRCVEPGDPSLAQLVESAVDELDSIIANTLTIKDARQLRDMLDLAIDEAERKGQS